jgi:hypothetical protein
MHLYRLCYRQFIKEGMVSVNDLLAVNYQLAFLIIQAESGLLHSAGNREAMQCTDDCPDIRQKYGNVGL